MEKVKSFNVAKAIELLKKTNQPRSDAKKKTKFDNTLDLFDALIVQEGRCVIYQRKAFAKIIGVSEMTFRNYLSKLGANGYKLSDVVIDGKNGEEVLKVSGDSVDAKPNDKNEEKLQSDNANPIDKPDETPAKPTEENADEVQLHIAQPTPVEGSLPAPNAGFLPIPVGGSLPTVQKSNTNSNHPQLRSDVKPKVKTEQPDGVELNQATTLKV